jgi:molybdopterin-guanine dinucleotide biosynthesis protein A
MLASCSRPGRCPPLAADQPYSAAPPGGRRPGQAQPWAAVILAGGRARRLGGTDKPGIAIGGRTLAASAVGAAVAADTSQIIVVGPPRPELITATPATAIEFTCEDPPGGGPVPALRAGLDLVTEPWLVLLAGDMPFLRERHLQAVLCAARQSGGAMMVDDSGRPQWLASCWRTTDLRRALATYSGDSLRGLLEPWRGVPVVMPPEPGQPAPWLDCDTPADLTAARDWAQRAIRGQQGGQIDEHTAELDRGGLRRTRD